MVVGVRCSSVVRAFAHSAMALRIDPLWWTHWAISCSSQCSMTGVTKVVGCIILSGMMHIKEPLLLIGISSPCGGSGFPLSLSEWSFTICLPTWLLPKVKWSSASVKQYTLLWLYLFSGLLFSFYFLSLFSVFLSLLFLVSSQCSMTGVSKAVVCAVLYVGWCI